MEGGWEGLREGRREGGKGGGRVTCFLQGKGEHAGQPAHYPKRSRK